MIVSLKGKTALVCGGSEGIGKATALALAAAGARVVLAARDREKLGQSLAHLPAEFDQVHRLVSLDMDKSENAAKAVQEVLAELGEVHILINNAGGPPGGSIAEASADQFLLAFERLLISAQLITQVCLPYMKSAGYGRIINIISTSVKAPLHGLGVSNTIRGAVANWAKTWANETAPLGITVNNVLPGATLTSRLSGIISAKASKSGKTESEITAEMLSEIPSGRFANPEEVASAVVFLASEQAAYITGINLPVDGGRTPNL
jgi:3-oxoacyl-[acyl-carrier protein] reductase